MIEINGNSYKLCNLDTNVISKVVCEPQSTGKGFLKTFSPSNVIPCFSPYTLFELRPKKDIYSKFIDFFSLYPCMILLSENQLFDEEQKSYPSPFGISPALFGFSTFNKPKGTDLKSMLDKVFQLPDVLQREKNWPNMKKEILASILGLKENFPPKGKTYNRNDAIHFVEEAGIQQIILRSPEWVRQLLAQGIVPDVNAFPSIKMSLFTVFYRFYEPDSREPETQDIFDILISAPTPYLDAIAVENFQAEITRKVSKCDKFIEHVEVYTLSDFRENAIDAA